MDKVIIHTATRVIVGVTNDDAYQVQTGFSLVPWKGAEKFSLESFSKLAVGDKAKVPATQSEIDLMTDDWEPHQKRKREFLLAVNDLINDLTVHPSIRTVFEKYKEMAKP